MHLRLRKKESSWTPLSPFSLRQRRSCALFWLVPYCPMRSRSTYLLRSNSCQSLLVISSRNLGRAVVDARFLKRVEAALQRNVRVVISITDPPGTDKPAIELERLRGRHLRLELQWKRRAAFYHLICDDVFALVCNRPLLGNLGKICTFRHVVGFLLHAPHLVSAFTNRVGADAGRPPGRDP